MAAVNKSHDPSSSTSYSYSRRMTKFDVFLSFRGEDTRKKFTDHLYIALKSAGINVFRDDNELRVGENISTKLLEAIQDSSISVIVFSRDYAASSWCLDELVKIMDCRETMEQVVLPIFYHVDPSDVRKQKRSYEEAFAKHDKRFKVDKMSRWRNALSKVAYLKGFHCEDSHEGEFVKKIVEEVRKHVSNGYLDVARYPVGLDSHVQNLDYLSKRYLDVAQYPVGLDSQKLDSQSHRRHSNDVCIIGIYAMGGMGKTTIAKAFYNHLLNGFEYKGFLDVSESSKNDDYLHLQNKLLSEILKTDKAGSTPEGTKAIEKRLNCTKVLIVLDNVDRLEQLYNLAITREREQFALGSKIIITTRDVDLLTLIKVDCLYRVEELQYDESLKLFCWHAFSRSHPEEDYVDLSKAIIEYCKGLPLALTVLGSLFIEKGTRFWEDTLKKFKNIPDDDIQKKLKISYDALDRKQRAIFLDVACFFIGMDKDYVHAILEACDLYPENGITILITRSLLTINRNNKLMMHDLLRDMGREIVRDESNDELGNYSRLWLKEHILNVLEMQPKGTKSVEGLILKSVEQNLLNEKHFKTEAFASMYRLRLLQLAYVNLNGSYDHFSKNLRWICWHGFPLKLIPDNFHLEHLVHLDMRYSKLREFSKEIKILGKLKVLNLSHSHYLRKTPNFSKIPNLEKLKLKDCTRLVVVHPSIGNLHKLVRLDMRDCKELKSLPDNICMLKALRSLNLSGCLKFERLPNDMRDMEALVELLVDKTAIRQVPAPKEIQDLSLCGCTRLASGSFGLAFWNWLSPRKSLNFVNLLGLTSLTSLKLKDCNLSDDVILKDFGSLSSLKSLDLSGNNFCCLPELPANLSNLFANNCINLLSLPAQFCNIPQLEVIEVSGCTSLKSIPELPECLETLTATDCPSLERLPTVPKCYYRISAAVMKISRQDKIVASGLMGAIPQNPGYVEVHDEENIPSQFQHQSMSPRLSLTVLGYFEDAVLDVCMSYYDAVYAHIHALWLTRYGGLELRNGDQLEIEIHPASFVMFKKLGVRVYDKSEGGLGTIQLNGVNEIIMHNSHSHSDSDFPPAGKSVFNGGGDSDNTRTLYFDENFHRIYNPIVDVRININGKCLKTL